VHSSSGREIRQDTQNPFESLDPTGSGHLSQDELNVAVECLIQRQGEDLVSLAKDSGRELYSNQSLPERKEKLNTMVSCQCPALFWGAVFVFIVIKAIIWLFSFF